MDDILHMPHSGGAAGQTASGSAADFLRRVRGGIEHQAETGWKIVNPRNFLLVAAAVGALSMLVGVYTPGCSVSMDGVELGAVADRSEFEASIDHVEARAAAILGHDYEMEHEFTYHNGLVERADMGPATRFEPFLMDQVSAVMKSYVLRVDGEIIGAAENADALNAVLDEIKASYVTENTVEASFVSGVSIDSEYIPADVTQNMDRMRSVLTANTNGETTYTVEKGDTFSQIAKENEMTLREMENLNPDVNINRLMVGQELTVKEAIPFLSVRTVDREVYTEEIPCPVEKVSDDSMYQGDSKVLDAGIPGESLITANVAYLNGHEKDRQIVEELVVAEPTTKVVAVGTKERPTWMPKGNFIWPLHGVITSPFGYRSVFGSYSFHGGIDIAAPYGTRIAASDGGTVKFAGPATGYNWSYGNMVIIDHGNGKQTYYAHCSSVLVSAGDHVYQGQTIARVGSTGRSTGNHCHFEVRVNGSRVNPMNYLH